MHRTFLLKTLLASLMVVIGIAGSAIAVPYASGIRNTTGTTWEFVLNQPASGVTVMRDGGSPLSLGALAAGRYTFDMTGHSTFDIKVSNSASTAWSQLPFTTGKFTDFERPTGMAVNSNPANLTYFGTVYVNNSNPATTGTGRLMGDGVYALSADLKGINANDYSVVASDTTNTALAPNWTVASSTSSAWRMSLDDAGNVIVSDWSDAHGGMKWASRDLTDGGPLLNGEQGPQFGVPHPTVPNAYMHGSIMSKPYVTGTLGTNLTVSAIDEDLESSFNAADGDNLWKWNVGATKDHVGSTVLPTLVMDGGSLVDGASSPNDSAGTPWFENSGGHFADSTYSPAKNRWYISGASTYGEEKSSLLVVDASGGTPIVKWSSKQFSIDHGLDGMPASAVPNSAGINDILRDAWAMKLSADGTKLYVGLSKAHRDVAGGDNNPYVGPNSTHVPGAILILPLDANGLPNIQVSDNGTPGDTTDDYLTNVQSFFLPADGLPASGNLDRINIDVDAAGNVYVTDNITEKLRVFSPGGNTLATTSSNGTFNLAALAAGLAGDFNSDGKVDAGDYATWRKNSSNGSLPNDNGLTTQAGRYSLWRSSFGTPGSGSASLGGGAVPEPSTVGLALIGMLSVLAGRRRRIG